MHAYTLSERELHKIMVDRNAENIFTLALDIIAVSVLLILPHTAMTIASYFISSALIKIFFTGHFDGAFKIIKDSFKNLSNNNK